ncbi:hypothetical protein [Deinococcus aerophilus]|uniref:Uncharacterized protein n=1 Tax=Deinococcus aerophilus TaxID=522488 RepID=A0ABQ2GR58_9DEIO|nr:hypothetical protein [Deinococcus aerophilus]GGM07552.1 hypothetical protein GCM10010841_14810 [Deinococcus aerophilus]
MVHCSVEVLGVLIGAAMAVAVLLPSVALPRLWARGLAVLGFGTLLVVGAVVLSGDRMERSFGLVYLAGSVLAAGVLALPRRLRWAAWEPLWVSLGLGLAALALLIAGGVGLAALLSVVWSSGPQADVSIRTGVAQGVSNGVLLTAPPTVLVLSLWGWRNRVR